MFAYRKENNKSFKTQTLFALTTSMMLLKKKSKLHLIADENKEYFNILLHNVSQLFLTPRANIINEVFVEIKHKFFLPLRFLV